MRCRQHVNPLGLAFETFRGRRPVLPPGVPVELEIGCADAQFLFERAALDPERVYCGIDVRDQLVDFVNDRAAQLGAPVQGIFANANNHLADLFAPGSVARVYLNFPDPWFKRRHRKRRMIDDVLIRQVAEVLMPGGDLFVQTDVWGIALDAISLLEDAPDAFENRAGEWAFWKAGNPFGARSLREQRCEQEGLSVWRLLYRRQRL